MAFMDFSELLVLFVGFIVTGFFSCYFLFWTAKIPHELQGAMFDGS